MLTARSRTTDPVTSAMAASSVTGLTETQERIVATLKAHGPLTRDQLIATWREEYGPDQTDQSIRSRLAELMHDGRVEPVGQARNARGRHVQILDLTPSQ